LGTSETHGEVSALDRDGVRACPQSALKRQPRDPVVWVAKNAVRRIRPMFAHPADIVAPSRLLAGTLLNLFILEPGRLN
jgi:hypothetical protein